MHSLRKIVKLYVSCAHKATFKKRNKSIVQMEQTYSRIREIVCAFLWFIHGQHIYILYMD